LPSLVTDINELDAVWDAATISFALNKGLESFFSCELASAISKFQREDLKRTLARKANEEKERFDAFLAIHNRLRTIESGDSFGWWELNLAFLADERGELVEEFNSDLTATKVWSALELSTRERVLSTAVKYLTHTHWFASAPMVGYPDVPHQRRQRIRHLGLSSISKNSLSFQHLSGRRGEPASCLVQATCYRHLYRRYRHPANPSPPIGRHFLTPIAVKPMA
jgi:hypothetical protein